VIDAAEAGLFVAPEEQGCATVRAMVLQQGDLPGAVTKRDQPFAEQHHPHRIAVGTG
jgi:hypothetical protein